MPPNIIYILGDDHRADYLGIAGHPVLQTPEIDRLAAEGTYFKKKLFVPRLCVRQVVQVIISVSGNVNTELISPAVQP